MFKEVYEKLQIDLQKFAGAKSEGHFHFHFHFHYTLLFFYRGIFFALG